MPGETALDRLLSGMAPMLCEDAYTFSVFEKLEQLPSRARIFATVHEDEGITVIAPERDIEGAGPSGTGTWARISLNIHSALSAVGLTAAVSGALATVGISANVIAGHYHDHLFVPWEQRHRALDVLVRLSHREGLES